MDIYDMDIYRYSFLQCQDFGVTPQFQIHIQMSVDFHVLPRCPEDASGLVVQMGIVLHQETVPFLRGGLPCHEVPKDPDLATRSPEKKMEINIIKNKLVVESLIVLTHF